MLPFTWPDYENVLYQQTVALLQSFAQDHRDEVFYAFCFDCDCVYGVASPSLNTEDQLQQHYKRMRAGEYGYPPVTRSFEEFAAEVRLNSGDWGYQHLQMDGKMELTVQGEIFESAISPYEDAFEVYSSTISWDDNSLSMDFIKSVCRVLYKMEATNVFDCIQTTEDFIIFVIDHDQDTEEAIREWQEFRAKI